MNKRFWSISPYVIFILFLLPCCKKDEPQEKSYPRTLQEIKESIKVTNFIAAESSPIVESAISEAYNQNGFLDPFAIAKKIELIPGVKSAIPTPSGTGIVIMQDDSTFSNLLLVSQDDDRLFKETMEKSKNYTVNNTNKSFRNYVVPNGSGKALILAPFQNSLAYVNLDEIVRLLRSSGFSVDQFINSEVTLDRIRGSFLNKYDIVFIVTHGASNYKSRNGVLSTILFTGEEFTDYRNSLLTKTEQNSVGIVETGGKSYFALSVPWLKATIGENFTNSWVFACACESSMDDTGTGSLSKAFLELGAGGFNGFDASINTQTANSVADLMAEKFTSGLPFSEASDQVRSNSLLLLKTWFVRLRDAKGANVSLFDNNQISTDPFYLVPPPIIKIPTVTTKLGSDILSTSASVGGEILFDGGSTVSEFGVYWGILSDPQINGTKVKVTSLTKSFTYNLTGLNPGATYYVTAYAINSVGTGYGNQINFTTNPVLSTPKATTNPATFVVTTSATLNGSINASNQSTSVTFEYGTTTSYGHYVNASPYTLSGNINTNVIASLTGLSENTTYHFRVSAVNSTGTTNGNDMSFTTSSSTNTGSVTDIEGNTYKTVQIGTQTWMAENLKTIKYNDGTAIPNIQDYKAWSELTIGAYVDYNNAPTNSSTYGRLYNWYTVDNNASTKVASNGGKNICPTGWHVSSDAEWTILTSYLGGDVVAGGKLKDTGYWASPNIGATNETGFTALPGGYRDYSGTYSNIGSTGLWWSSTENTGGSAWYRVLYDYKIYVYRNTYSKNEGNSVRCIKDN